MPGRELDERIFDDGETVIAEGDTSREMFIIREGRAVVTKSVSGSDVFLATLERGDFFGEMSLLESLPRNATVRAIGRTRLVVLRAVDLLLKIRRDPTFAFEMLQRMSGRIRQLNQKVIDLLESERISRERVDKLMTAVEYSGRSHPE